MSLGEATADGTTYQEWNTFSSPSGPNEPDVEEPVNPNGVANLFDSAAPGSGAFIASSGNIYSFSGVIEPEATVPTTLATTEFLVQLRTQGSQIDVNDLTVNGEAATGLPGYSYTELDRVAAGGVFGGAIVDHAWTFTAAPASLYTLEWGWGVTSASVDMLIIDTLAILLGDFTEDGLVTIADIDGLLIAIAAGDSADAFQLSRGDFTGDGLVSIADIDGFLIALAGGSPLAVKEAIATFETAGLAIPQPASIAVLFVGAGWWLWRSPSRPGARATGPCTGATE